MKRIAAVCLCLAILLLAGCAGTPVPAPTATPTPTPAPEPTPTPTPEPETDGASVVTLDATAVLAVLERGEQVLIEGEWEEYYVVEAAAGRGYVEKRLLARDSEPEYEPWTGYAVSGAEVYLNYRLSGAPERVLDTNTEMTVLADLGDCYLAELEGSLGYVPAEMVSSSRIEYHNYYYGGGGGSSGGGSSGGADGGDISLGYSVGGVIPAVCLSSSAGQGGTARVTAVSAELIAAFFQRGDKVRVFSQDDESCTLYIDGEFACVYRRCILMDSEEPYNSWAGYAASGAALHGSSYLNDSPVQLALNTELTVLADLGGFYLVSVSDGSMGYLIYEHVSETPIVYNYYGGSGGGGGGSSGGGEWTEPVL